MKCACVFCCDVWCVVVGMFFLLLCSVWCVSVLVCSVCDLPCDVVWFAVFGDVAVVCVCLLACLRDLSVIY